MLLTCCRLRLTRSSRHVQPVDLASVFRLQSSPRSIDDRRLDQAGTAASPVGGTNMGEGRMKGGLKHVKGLCLALEIAERMVPLTSATC